MTAPSASFLTWRGADAAWVDVAVVPNAKRTEAIGLHDGALRVRLAAPPVEGAANLALQRWLAEALGVARSDVTLVRGASGRRKRLLVQADGAQVQAWLTALQAAGVVLA